MVQGTRLAEQGEHEASSLRSVRNEARSASLRTRPSASSSVNDWLLVSGRFQPTTGGCLLQSHMKDTSGVGKEDWLVFGEGDAIGTGADAYGFEGTVAQRNITVTGSYCICCGTFTDLTACRQVLIVCLSRKDSVEVTKCTKAKSVRPCNLSIHILLLRNAQVPAQCSCSHLWMKRAL